MKPFIPALLVVAGVAAGGTAGAYLKSSGAPQTVSGGVHLDAAPEAGDKEKAAKSSDHGSKGEASSSDVTYFKFSREFVVPLMRDGAVESLVILNISLEIDAKHSTTLFSMEPKLRDNIMTTLVALSNDGRTFETMTNVDSYESIRALVLSNLENVAPNTVKNVLILDAAKQDV